MYTSIPPRLPDPPFRFFEGLVLRLGSYVQHTPISMMIDRGERGEGSHELHTTCRSDPKLDGGEGLGKMLSWPRCSDSWNAPALIQHFRSMKFFLCFIQNPMDHTASTHYSSSYVAKMCTRNNTDCNKLVIFFAIALYYGNNHVDETCSATTSIQCSSIHPSLMPSSCVPPGKKQSGEQSWIFGGPITKVLKCDKGPIRLSDRELLRVAFSL